MKTGYTDKKNEWIDDTIQNLYICILAQTVYHCRMSSVVPMNTTLILTVRKTVAIIVESVWYWVEVRLFLSSMFIDTQAERDMQNQFEYIHHKMKHEVYFETKLVITSLKCTILLISVKT